MSAPVFATCIITGQRGTFQLSDPAPRFSFNRTDVDELDDSWHSDYLDNATLTEGRPHPKYPGLILDVATPTQEVPEFEVDGATVPGSYTFACKWIGDARGKTPTKFIGRSSTRTVGIGFDQFTEKYISWNAEPAAITGTASTKLINHPGNNFSDGLRICFPSLTGGSGIAGGSITVLPTVYYVINRTADNYQIATTLGGTAVDPVTNITAGYVIDARFCPGTVHPLWPAMYVTAVSTSDNYTAWKNVEVTYSGKQFDRPFHRIVTSAGVQMSSSAPIAWDFPDGWTTELNSNVQMPEIVCTDTYLTTNTLATDTIPGSNSEVGDPPNAPLIRSVFIFGDDTTIIYNWPNGWSRLGEDHVETLNSQISVHIKKRVSRYIWPISLK
ncbi:hypothetical protein [Prosthecobacter sp.]|uniref:hypothetical protein n=1 Tax=Prosthecobacter sp. TaxID=1965333 RepID=UPI003782D720